MTTLLPMHQTPAELLALIVKAKRQASHQGKPTRIHCLLPAHGIFVFALGMPEGSPNAWSKVQLVGTARPYDRDFEFNSGWEAWVRGEAMEAPIRASE